MRATISAVLILLAAASAPGQDPGGAWTLFGSNEILLEDYDVSGDSSVSPFPFEGTFYTDRLSFDLGWSDGPRDLVVHADLLASDSDYLPEDGLVVGALSLQFENGASTVPYRFQAGDLFADISRRVLQRQLRGAMLELQPALGGGSHSIVVLAGSGAPDWHSTFDDPGALTFTGASWLWQNESGTNVLVGNVTGESADAGAEGAFPVPATSIDNLAASLAVRTLISALTLEWEVSVLDSDVPGADEATSYYAELARATGPLRWRARYEDNHRDYSPLGAMGVIPGRSTAEAEARWFASPRTSLWGRAQHIESSTAPGGPETSTDLAGIAWEARPIASRPGFGVQLTLDANSIEADDASQDLLYQSYGVEVRDWLTDLHDLTLRSTFRDARDDVRPEFDRESFDNELILGRSFRGASWSGRVGGGLAYRRQRGSGPFDTLSPLAELNLRIGPHRIHLHYGYADQDSLAPGAFDVTYQSRRATYSYASGDHELSLEYGQELREPDGLIDTDSSRIAIRYRYAFAREF